MRLSFEIMTVLLLLAPGFLASMLLRLFTGRKAGEFLNQVVEALIWSFAIYAVASIFGDALPLVVEETEPLKVRTDARALVVGLISAIILPAVLSALLNKDLLMRPLRAMGVTVLRARESTWHDVFAAHRNYVIVTMKDGRRIYGWPEYSSRDPNEGLIYLKDPHWVTDDKFIDMKVLGILLANKEKIDYVSFLHRLPPQSDAPNESPTEDRS